MPTEPVALFGVILDWDPRSIVAQTHPLCTSIRFDFLDVFLWAAQSRERPEAQAGVWREGKSPSGISLLREGA